MDNMFVLPVPYGCAALAVAAPVSNRYRKEALTQIVLLHWRNVIALALIAFGLNCIRGWK